MFKGSITALVTPFTNGAVDEQGFHAAGSALFYRLDEMLDLGFQRMLCGMRIREKNALPDARSQASPEVEPDRWMIPLLRRQARVDGGEFSGQRVAKPRL